MGKDGFFYDEENREYYLYIDKKKTRFSIKAAIFDKLYPYQREGIKWLCEKHSCDGGILGVSLLTNYLLLYRTIWD